MQRDERISSEITARAGTMMLARLIPLELARREGLTVAGAAVECE